MSFDGLGDVFGARGAKPIARKVEGRQRPVILDGIGKGDGTKRTATGWGHKLARLNLPVFQPVPIVISELQVIPAIKLYKITNFIVADIQARQCPLGSVIIVIIAISINNTAQ